MHFNNLLRAVALATLLLNPVAARATTYYWDTTSTGLWGTGANWSNNATSGGTTGTVPLSTDSAWFNQSTVNGATTAQLSLATTIAGITFANTGTTLIDSSSTTSNALSIGTGGITINSGAGAVTIGDATNLSPVTLTGAQNWTNSSSNLFSVVNNVTNGGNLMTVTGTGNTAISGVIGNGAGGLSKSGAGTLTLSGNNTFTGGVNISAGTLNINNAHALGATAGVLTLGGTIDNTSGAAITNTGNNAITLNNFTFSTSAGTALNNLNLGTGVVSIGDAKTITLNGAGALTLGGTATNTSAFIRALTVNNGAGTTSTSGLTLGALALSSSGATQNGFILAGNANVTVTGPVTYGTGLSTSTLGITNSGTTTLLGANTYTGATTVGGGVVNIGNGTTGSLNGTAGTALIFSNSGAINFNEAAGAAQGMGVLTLAAGTSVSPAGGSATIQSIYGGSGNTSLTFASLARGLATSVNFVTTGGANGSTNKIAVTAATANAYMGQGTFFGGSSYAWNDTTGYVRGMVYGSDTGAVTSAGATSLASATHQQITGAITGQNTASFTTLNIANASNFTITAGQSLNISDGILKSGGGSSTLSGGTLVIPNFSEGVIRVDSASDALTISSAVSPSTGSTSVTKTGAGLLTLSGASSSWTLVVTEGTVRAGSTTGVGTGVVMMNNFAGATLDLNGFNTSLVMVLGGGLAGGNVTLGSATLTLTTTSSTYNYAGAISGTGGLTRSGASGIIPLYGASTYTGATTVSGGTLTAGVASVANVSGAFGNNSAVVLANVAGAVLNLNGFNNQIGSLTGGGATGGNVTLGAATLTTGGDNTSPAAFAGVISGTGGSLTKIGTGTQILRGNNTYTGATTVSVGTLLINGNSIAATGAIAVTNGAILGGGGTVGAAINSAGTLSPGDGTTAIGTFNATALTLNTGANFKIDLGGSNASDRISLTGAFTRGTGTSFSINFNNTGVANSTYTLATFASLAGGFTAGDVSNFSYTGLAGGVTGGTFGLTGTDLTFTTVPEPATWALLAFSLTTVIVLRRRRNS